MTSSSDTGKYSEYDWDKTLSLLQIIAVQVLQVEKICNNNNNNNNSNNNSNSGSSNNNSKFDKAVDIIVSSLAVHIKTLLSGGQLNTFFPEYDRDSQFAICNRCFIDISLKSIDLKILAAQSQETVILLREQVQTNVRGLFSCLKVLESKRINSTFGSGDASTISDSSASSTHNGVKRGNYGLVNDILKSLESRVSLDDSLRAKKSTFFDVATSHNPSLTSGSSGGNSASEGNVERSLRSQLETVNGSLEAVNGSLAQRRLEASKLQKIYNAVTSEVRILESELSICNRHLNDINHRYGKDIELFSSACVDVNASPECAEIEDASIRFIDSLNEMYNTKVASSHDRSDKKPKHPKSKYSADNLRKELKNGLNVLHEDAAVSYLISEKMAIKTIFKDIKINEISIDKLQKDIKVFTSLKMGSSKASEGIEASILALRSKNKKLHKDVHSIQKNVSCFFLDYSLCSAATSTNTNNTAATSTNTNNNTITITAASVKTSEGEYNEDNSNSVKLSREQITLYQEIYLIVDLLQSNNVSVLHDLKLFSLAATATAATTTTTPTTPTTTSTTPTTTSTSASRSAADNVILYGSSDNRPLAARPSKSGSVKFLDAHIIAASAAAAAQNPSYDTVHPSYDTVHPSYDT